MDFDIVQSVKANFEVLEELIGVEKLKYFNYLIKEHVSELNELKIMVSKK